MLREYFNRKAEKKGYTIEQEQIDIFIPFIGTFYLPLWFGVKWLYISPKHKTRYYIKGLTAKFRMKKLRKQTQKKKELASIFTRSGIHPKNPYKFYK